MIAALISVCACGPDLGSASACPSAGTTLSWATFGSKFTTQYCVACHGGARVEKNVNLTTAVGFRANGSGVVSQAGTSTTMPQAGSPAPTPLERQQLTNWVSCGAP